MKYEIVSRADALIFKRRFKIRPKNWIVVSPEFEALEKYYDFIQFKKNMRLQHRKPIF